MPVTLIERAQGIKRSQVYEDINRAKEIFRLDPDFQRDLFYETAESLREAWQNYQNADNELRKLSEDPVQDKAAHAAWIAAKMGLEIGKSTYLGMIDKMLRTRIEAAKLLIPKSESLTVTSVPTPSGVATRFELKTETKDVTQLLNELRKEGKIGNQS